MPDQLNKNLKSYTPCLQCNIGLNISKQNITKNFNCILFSDFSPLYFDKILHCIVHCCLQFSLWNFLNYLLFFSRLQTLDLQNVLKAGRGHYVGHLNIWHQKLFSARYVTYFFVCILKIYQRNQETLLCILVSDPRIFVAFFKDKKKHLKVIKTWISSMDILPILSIF